MDTTMIDVPVEGGRISLEEYDVVVEDQFWVIRPRNEPEVDPEDTEMERREATYTALHPTLKETYLGQYVAIQDEEVVDSDKDRIALRRRLMEAYPDRFMPIRLVEEHLPRPLRMPRIRLLPDTADYA